MSVNNLKIAYVQVLDGNLAGKSFKVLFNPNEYTIEKGNQFQSAALPGLATPVTQFVNGNADTLSMELFFDTYAPGQRHNKVNPGEDVRKYTNQFSQLMDVDSHLHAPPIVEFIWGSPLGSPGDIQFKAIIEKMTQKFTMFNEDGIPVRATINVTFKEYKTVADQLREIGRQSTDKTKRRVVKEGDSIWMFAAKELDDPRLWREIAEKNNMDNVRDLEPGSELVIPPLL